LEPDRAFGGDRDGVTVTVDEIQVGDTDADWEPAALAALEATPGHLRYFAQAVRRCAPGPAVGLVAARDD
jgi:hypothetical protein